MSKSKKSTKFNIGDTVFYLCDNMVFESIVTLVVKTDKGDVFYSTNEYGEHEDIGKIWNLNPESDLFSTKEKLLESL